MASAAPHRGAFISRKDTRSNGAFFAALQDGLARWNDLIRSTYPETEQQVAFLKSQRDHAIVSVGTHGEIVAELDTPPKLFNDNGVTEYPDGPVHFSRFDVPPGVSELVIFDGGFAPGVCFSEEETAAGVMRRVLDVDPSNPKLHAVISSRLGAELDTHHPDESSDEEVLVTQQLLRLHKKSVWTARSYTPQPVAGALNSRPPVKRFIATVPELKQGALRLFEWHITAFIKDDENNLLVVDLNPYLFDERVLAQTSFRSGDRAYFKNVYAETTTPAIVNLFSSTGTVKIFDSTCSVPRFKVEPGLIDNIDIHSQKDTLHKLVEDFESATPSDKKREINRLINILIDNLEHHNIKLGPKFDELRKSASSIASDIDAKKTMIAELLASQDTSTWIQQTTHPEAWGSMLAEHDAYMTMVMPDKAHASFVKDLSTFTRKARDRGAKAKAKAKAKADAASSATSSSSEDDHPSPTLSLTPKGSHTTSSRFSALLAHDLAAKNELTLDQRSLLGTTLSSKSKSKMPPSSSSKPGGGGRTRNKRKMHHTNKTRRRYIKNTTRRRPRRHKKL